MENEVGAANGGQTDSTDSVERAVCGTPPGDDSLESVKCTAMELLALFGDVLELLRALLKTAQKMDRTEDGAEERADMDENSFQLQEASIVELEKRVEHLRELPSNAGDYQKALAAEAPSSDE